MNCQTESFKSIAPVGQQPSGELINTTRITATVENVNRKNSKVTLRGPEGGTKTLTVENPGFLKRLHKGDQVLATYTETYMIHVVQSGPPRAGRYCYKHAHRISLDVV